MLKIIKIIDNTLIQPFNSLNTLFIDIETDGLGHKNKLVIIGIILCEKRSNHSTLIQLFNDDYMSEREMLLELINTIKTHDIDYTVSFNGNSFDIPFLNARYKHYKIDYYLTKHANVDLLRLARSNQATLGLSDYKLKSVERFVGIERTDTISGKDSIILYHAFIETRSESLKNSILLHNSDDLINMIPLLKITQNMSGFINPMVTLSKRKWYLASTELKANALTCKLSLNQRLTLIDLFYETNGIKFECCDTEALIKFDLIALKDSNNNMYHFMNSQLLHNKTLDQLDESLKSAHLISFNRVIQVENLNKQVFKTVETLLAILGVN